jgi:uncharacterized protein YciI
MKSNVIIFLFTSLIISCNQIIAQADNKAYNKALADSLGADEYGMKNYFFVILRTGPANTDDKEKVSQAFRGHLDNISRLVKINKLIIAGPFGKNDKEYRGLYIFSAADRKEMDELLATDPAIKEGYLVPEVFEWYGSAALPMYLEYSKKITKTSI